MTPNVAEFLTAYRAAQKSGEDNPQRIINALIIESCKPLAMAAGAGQ